jgi:glycogen operon protein
VNFVTCHDGFTLNDLVSYNHKHNEANGEGNRDGADDNRSWNCGVEGPSDDPEVEKLRNRQVKNFMAVTLLSVGMPMILMGDEARRTQSGNNNGYCLDTGENWLDWSLLGKHADVHRFVTLLNEMRQMRDFERAQGKLSLVQFLRQADIDWHGVKVGQPDWGDHSHTIAFTVQQRGSRFVMHCILNAYWEALEFELPAADASGTPWRRWIDTALESPHDIESLNEASIHAGQTYRVEPRATVVLVANAPS